MLTTALVYYAFHTNKKMTGKELMHLWQLDECGNYPSVCEIGDRFMTLYGTIAAWSRVTVVFLEQTSLVGAA